MPKMKSKRALRRRFRITGTGKVRRQHSGLRHILTKKSAKRKRQLARPALVSEAQKKMYRDLLSV